MFQFFAYIPLYWGAYNGQVHKVEGNTVVSRGRGEDWQQLCHLMIQFESVTHFQKWLHTM